MVKIVAHVHGRVRRLVIFVDPNIGLHQLAQLGAPKKLIDKLPIQRCLRSIAIGVCDVLDQVLRVVVDCTLGQTSRCDHVIFVHRPELLDQPAAGRAVFR